MSTPVFETIDGVTAVVEIGLGDTRIEVGQARFDVAEFNEAVVATFSGLEPSWVDITCYAQTVEFELGRNRATDRFVPGAAQLTMLNETGWADIDPDNIATLTMRAGRPLRIGVDHVDFGRRWKFSGFIDSITPIYDPDQDDTIIVECIDALGEVGRTKLAQLDTPVGAGERGSTRINRILDAATWTTERRQIASTSTTMIATDLGGQTLDLLTQCADSEGGGVFGDLEGRVAYRGKDWQTYPPDQPNDGTIGNVGTALAREAVPAYLIGQYGYVTTPDTSDLTPPNVFTIPFKIQGPINDGDVYQTIAVHENWTSTGWLLQRANTDGALWFITASGFDAVAFQAITSGADEYGAITVTQDNGSGQHELTSWTSPDGVTWTQGSTVANAPAWTIPDPVADVMIGQFPDGYGIFYGRIYSVEFRRGNHPTAGLRSWYFNANDWPGYGETWWTEGRPWTVSSPAAITLMLEAAPAEVCPSGWEMSHARKDIVTRVVLGRDDDGATSQETYNDLTAQAMYGVESPFQLTDLTCVEDSQLDRIADRLFRTRGKYVTPRVDAVEIDASTSTAARDLLTLVDVFQPSRYRCRHVLPRGTIFDTTFFATGIRHRMTRNEWTARISLDLASPWEAIGARFDQADFDNALYGA